MPNLLGLPQELRLNILYRCISAKKIDCCKRYGKCTKKPNLEPEPGHFPDSYLQLICKELQQDVSIIRNTKFELAFCNVKCYHVFFEDGGDPLMLWDGRIELVSYKQCLKTTAEIRKLRFMHDDGRLYSHVGFNVYNEDSENGTEVEIYASMNPDLRDFSKDV